MSDAEKIKRNVKKFIREIQARTKKMPELDRLDQFFEIGVALGNVYKLSEIMGGSINVPWASKQKTEGLVEMQRGLADAYVSLANVYIEYVDSKKSEFQQEPEAPPIPKGLMT